MVRNSLKYVSWKQRKEVATDLKTIYQAATAEQAEINLTEFEAKWDKTHLAISQSWRRNWEQIIPFFCLSTRNSQGDLHDQRHRIAKYVAAQGH